VRKVNISKTKANGGGGRKSRRKKIAPDGTGFKNTGNMSKIGAKGGGEKYLPTAGASKNMNF